MLGQFEPDKINHFAAGYITGGIFNYASKKILKLNDTESFLVGLGASILIGGLQETRGVYEFNDIVATTLGGLYGSFTINVFEGKRKRRKQKLLIK